MLAGFLAASALLQALAWAWLLGAPDWRAPWQDALGASAALAALTTAFGLPLGLALGPPLLRASRRWGSKRALGLGLAGAALGLLAGAGLWLGLLRHSHAGPAVMVALAAAGAVGAWVAQALEGRQ